MTTYIATAELYAWAIPNRYKIEESEPDFHISVMKGEGKPYNDGAFRISHRSIEWEVTIPEDHVEQQITALKAEIEEEHVTHARRILMLAEQISNLQALPAPK